MMKAPILVLISSLLLSEPVPRVTLLPVDEARTDASLVEFRDRLIRVARLRDLSALLELTTPTAMVTPGVPGDIAQLRQAFFRESAEWLDLFELLQMGGSFMSQSSERPRFCAPYTYSRFPELWTLPDGYVGEVDPWVVTGSDVAVRAGPSLQTPAIARLSHELVRYLESVGPWDQNRPAWVRVLTPRGESGYVHGSLIRSHDDHHACFEKLEAGWRMVEFFER